MKKKFLNTILGFVLIGLSVSCTKDFEEINKDPNNPADPNTELLISNVIRQIGNQGYGIAGWAKDIYPQYMAEIQYTNESRFQNKFYDFSAYYNGPLLDAQTILNLNSDPATANLPYVQKGGSTDNQIGVSRILKAFFYLHMTDRWGMLPYSEALKGKEVLTPKYDTQKDIYTSLLKELKEAAAQLKTGEALNGDILFQGNVSKWVKWANSLRMVAAIHLADVDPNLAKAEFASAYAAGAIASNADNAVFAYLNDANNQNPLYNNYFVGKRTDYAVSEKMIETLEDLADPRLPVYAEKVVQGGGYKGMPYGLANADDDLNQETVSLIGKKFTAQNYGLPITTYAQIQFMLAEAAYRGWGTGDAATFYKKGIDASMQQQGVTAPASYFTQSGVAYNAANGLKLIITQKWLANYQANGYESWVDWRRTGFPELHPGPAPLSIDKKIPVRQAYPNTESGLNGKNYEAAVAAQGPDELNTRLWWGTK
ncbi:SusD/RagB family nutrient-binding outer membrane lipoprotein [Sphingobacterium sp.]|uniref:SusD/RagB family nutrient-binding outer membrane lipoprotein n=1 Tax=Sphingobacterium sp. TaxID=341027 RepID=UPI0028AB6340|nr:SusD/RagB family nutrient-binding outer membrane lipoprotein [Sphingobacterium sp.]